MATGNPFDLLGDDDNDDPTHLIAIQQQKIAAKKPDATPPAAAAKLPSKPVPPAQAVRESRNNTAPQARGGFGRGGPGRGRGARGAGFVPNRNFEVGNDNGFTGGYGGAGGGGSGYGGGGGDEADTGKTVERGERERTYGPPRGGGSFRGGRRGGYGGYGNEEAGGDAERPPRRVYERRSGTGRGNEIKREGGGRRNWGTVNDDVLAQETEENLNTDEKVVTADKQPEQEDGAPDVNKDDKESPKNEAQEKEEEEKEMTLEEYEKIREEKRKALLALKSEERKVEVDKEFESMQQLSLKKGNDEIFIKLGSDKEKRKENAEKEERARKALSINEFLKPADGERYYGPSGRGRGRGRGERGSFRGGYGGAGVANNVAAPSIEDPGHFPTLGGK